MFLAPTLGAVAAHIPAIEEARIKERHSFAQFIASSIQTALAKDHSTLATSDAADEFDQLFGSAREEP